MEVFNEDRVTHPQNAHVFAVPRLMIHLWRKHLGKDADIFMTITKNLSPNPLFLLLSYLLLMLKITADLELHVSWEIKKELEPYFKIAGGQDPMEFFDMDGTLYRLWKDLEGMSRALIATPRLGGELCPCAEVSGMGLLPRVDRRPLAHDTV